MLIQVESKVKYRIISFSYDFSIERRLLFTIEEIGVLGEIRQYADEVVANLNWRSEFSIIDAALVLHAAGDSVDCSRVSALQDIIESQRQVNLD